MNNTDILTLALNELRKARDQNYNQYLRQTPDVSADTLGKQFTRLTAMGYENGMSAAVNIILCLMEEGKSLPLNIRKAHARMPLPETGRVCRY